MILYTKMVFGLCLVLCVSAAVHAQTKEIVVQQPPRLTTIYRAGLEIACPKPAWPHEALRYELEGKTTVEVLVGDDGKAHDQRVYQSSGWDILDEATLSMMPACRFSSIAGNGQQTGAHWSKFEFVWTLEQNGVREVSRPVLIRESCGGADGLVLVDNPLDGRGVLLRFLVSPDGKPFGIKVVNTGKNSVSAELNTEAARKLASCSFLPSVNKGRPVPGNAFARYQTDLSR